ncbi:hypothetical protein OsI_33278 [Oryza sativa Indica Group]|uniref:Uncharacterized protein n=1 Tax=Oryza sativa subsp. indica TaxID=39946 RepID=B8BGH6_ORYSI|nr:hypothetical protein OsI_33278 [Oryza sativa Indica Group]
MHGGGGQAAHSTLPRIAAAIAASVAEQAAIPEPWGLMATDDAASATLVLAVVVLMIAAAVFVASRGARYQLQGMAVVMRERQVEVLRALMHQLRVLSRQPHGDRAGHRRGGGGLRGRRRHHEDDERLFSRAVAVVRASLLFIVVVLAAAATSPPPPQSTLQSLTLEITQEEDFGENGWIGNGEAKMWGG